MGHSKKPYERTAERAERGEYDLVVPLDYLILEQLEEEGTMFGGLYQIGTSVKDLVAAFDGKITSTPLGGRLNALKAQKLVTPVRVMGKKSQNAWQRTANGKKLLEQWRAGNGAS